MQDSDRFPHIDTASRIRTLLALALLVFGGRTASALEGELDEIRWTNQDAWNCAQTIALRPFVVTGKFKGRKSQTEYLQQFATALATGLKHGPTIRDVSLAGSPSADGADLAIEGEFAELNTGSKAARFWVGFGAGKSKCRVRIRGLARGQGAPVFVLNHERISPMGLGSDELAENVDEVAKDVVVALLHAKGYCTASAVQEAAPPPAALVPVSIESDPAGADVFLDGQFVGTTPLSGYGMRPGSRELSLRKRGYGEWLRSLTVTAGVSTQVKAELEVEHPN